ncbi:MAG TPA: hypothetical protein VG889_10725 [Rhizomicrobium sp.]|nr:hypothetical protein [Rhizomicrobium sp.]
MPLFSDPLLAAVADGLSLGGLVISTAKAIYDFVGLLRAARSLQDVTLFAEVRVLENGRYAIQVTRNRIITFKFEPGIGPSALRLEKQGKSWAASRKPPSPRKPREKS